MAESKKTQETKPPESTALVVVKTKEGDTREMIRDTGSGKFVKKARPLIPTIEFTRQERKKLSAVRSDKEGLTEYMVAFMNMVRIAQYEGNDAKCMMAAVKAYEVLRLSALGKPASSEQDLDRITTQPVKTIIVVAPSLMHPEVQEEKNGETKTQPSAQFLKDVEFITNEK